MVQLSDIQRQTEDLSQEEREGLVAYLLHRLSGMPPVPEDAEVDQRDADMDCGKVKPISHKEFISQVGRAK
jgi:hypothetical protein